MCSLDKPQTVTLGTLDIHPLYKGVETYASFFTFIAPSRTSSSNTQNLSSTPPESSNMSGSDPQGRWVASSIKEKDIAKLRDVGCLTDDIQHRLPAPGQVIPTQEPNESAVLISHFLRVLGLTLDPFVRGLMFYYGLNFHDLAPDAILHISSFISCARLFSTSTHTSAYG